MLRVSPHPRGMALVMAMIVVVLVTLLVAGAISFTGTERAASEVQVQQDSMSACVQAARNLFLSKVQMSMQAIADPDHPASGVNVLPLYFEEKLPRTDPQTGHIDPLNQIDLRTGHLGQLASWSAKKVEVLADPQAAVRDATSVTGEPPVPTFYTVSAVCREFDTDLSSPEREVEFMVRVGF